MLIKAFQIKSSGAVIAAQLVERSLPIPEVGGSNPVIGKKSLNIYCLQYWKDENKRKREWEWPFKKIKLKWGSDVIKLGSINWVDFTNALALCCLRSINRLSLFLNHFEILFWLRWDEGQFISQWLKTERERERKKGRERERKRKKERKRERKKARER